MSEPSHPTNREIKVTLTIYLVGATFAALALWGWWALEHFTDYRFKGENRTEPISHWFAVIGTPEGHPICHWRRAAGILEHGVATAATIVELGMSQSGMQNVTLSFHHKGEELTVKTSASQTDLAGKRVGDRLDLIVDSRNPRRVLVKIG